MKHLIIALLIISSLFSQTEPDTTFDISLLATGEMWAIFNRTVAIVEDGGKRGVYLDEKPGQGVAWLPSFEIGDGVIEVDLKGRNEPGKSFVGIAFHGVNVENYELKPKRADHTQCNMRWFRRTSGVGYVLNTQVSMRPL